MDFKLQSEFKPTGDQPEAIEQLTEGITSNEKFQTLLGVTGSGKTFTVANVVENVNKPTLVLAHNKTLAAQLYSEFKQFFPNNAIEYFVSYFISISCSKLHLSTKGKKYENEIQSKQNQTRNRIGNRRWIHGA